MSEHFITSDGKVMFRIESGKTFQRALVFDFDEWTNWTLVEQDTSYIRNQVACDENGKPNEVLFDKGRKKRKKPQKLMHVCDAGPGPDSLAVCMSCSKCDLRTCWFAVRNVTEAKKGIPCPKCNDFEEFELNELGEYVP